MAKLDYDAYLRSAYWQYRAAVARSRAKHRCQLCDSNGLLHVHHRTYENLGAEDDADLIVLCEDCHRRFHRKNDKLESVGNILKGYTV